jgi:spore cortex biosynthesis protein YabQ
MWEITVKSQILTFFYAVTLGIILSVLFDFFRTIRISYKHNNIFVFIEDIIFFLISTFLTFMYLMARCNGEFRTYVISAILIGFFIYRITLSKIVLPTSVIITKFFIRLFGKIFLLFQKSVSLTVKNTKKLLKIRGRNKKTLER